MSSEIPRNDPMVRKRFAKCFLTKIHNVHCVFCTYLCKKYIIHKIHNVFKSAFPAKCRKHFAKMLQKIHNVFQSISLMYFVGKTYDQGAFSSSALYPIEIVKNRLQTLQVCACACARRWKRERDRNRERERQMPTCTCVSIFE